MKGLLLNLHCGFCTAISAKMVSSFSVSRTERTVVFPSELLVQEVTSSEILGFKSAVVCFSRCLPESSTDDER